MSVRFFKIFSGVFLAHLLVISFVWVGFPAPNSRPPVIFIYQGALPADEDTTGEEWPKEGASNQITMDLLGTSNFKHWTRLREPSKPYDHLGF